MEWWKKSVVYQIYPLSFCDSNADGIGDIRGIISKLDYLKKLGIDVIWMTPVYASPMDDNGYDICDYYAINPQFGTMADFEELLREVHVHGIKLIMDLVVNHTSDEHSWFKSALADKNSPHRDYYIFSDIVATDERSVFSGSAWEYSEPAGQYYFHLFSKRQPDLNWDNPSMRHDVYKMINWWLDKGIDGFRLDVIDLIGKQPLAGGINLDKTHTLLREMYAACFANRAVLTVGETPNATAQTAWQFSKPERQELSIGFEFVGLDEVKNEGKWSLNQLNLLDLKEVFSRWQVNLHNNGWNSLFWSNHDQPRIVSRFGDASAEYRVLSAKMLATLLHGLQGTPYIYQGEEIGMTNISMPIDECPDVETRNMIAEKRAAGWGDARIAAAVAAKGRDNARTPMQWSAEKYAGFSAVQPWLRVNDNYRTINAELSLSDEHSVFAHYQALIKLRREYEVVVSGDYTLLFPEHLAVFAYERKFGESKLTVVCNFYKEEVELALQLESAAVLLSNYNNTCIGTTLKLRAYEAIIFLHKAGV